MNRWRTVAIVVVVLGILLRLLPVNYGAPQPGYYSSDEIDAVSRSIKMLGGDLLPLHASKPTMYNVVLSGVIGTRYAGAYFLGARRADFEREFFNAPFPLYRLARLVSVAAASASLILLLLMLWKESSVGLLLAVTFLALARSSIFYGHVAKEDALAAMFVFISFIQAWRSYEQESRVRVRRIIISALAAGAAVSTKYNCFFAALFPLIAWWQTRVGWRVFALVAISGVAAFLIGTPHAALHPIDYIQRTFGSAVARQVAGSYNIMYYSNHRYELDNHGLAFMARLFWREMGPAIVAVVIAASAMFRLTGQTGMSVLQDGQSCRTDVPACPSRRLLWVAPLLAYILALLVSGQLDYQYALLITPIAAFMIGRIHPHLGRFRRAFVAAAVVAMAAIHLPLIARQTAEFLGGDTRLAAGEWLKSNHRAEDKPLLILSDHYYRYYPAIEFNASTYESLAQQARARGAEGGYYAGAARYASESGLSADFIRFDNSYTIRLGRRQFSTQPFDTRLSSYAGKYSLVILPENTSDILEIDEPGLQPLKSFISEATNLPLVQRFERKPWHREGPEICIYKAP